MPPHGSTLDWAYVGCWERGAQLTQWNYFTPIISLEPHATTKVGVIVPALYIRKLGLKEVNKLPNLRKLVSVGTQKRPSLVWIQSSDLTNTLNCHRIHHLLKRAGPPPLDTVHLFKPHILHLWAGPILFALQQQREAWIRNLGMSMAGDSQSLTSLTDLIWSSGLHSINSKNYLLSCSISYHVFVHHFLWARHSAWPITISWNTYNHSSV